MHRIPDRVNEMTGFVSFSTPMNTEHSRFSVPKMRTRNHFFLSSLPFFNVIVSLSMALMVPSYRMFDTDMRDTILLMKELPPADAMQ